MDIKEYTEKKRNEFINPSVFWYKQFGIILGKLPMNCSWKSSEKQIWIKAFLSVLDVVIKTEDDV